MGTNYYLRTSECESCGHYGQAHIGKSSAGWTFSFQATEKIRSAKDWKQEMQKGTGWIVDEYGISHTYDEFWAMVEGKRNEPHNHAKEYQGASYLDPEGNSMSPYEFS